MSDLLIVSFAPTRVIEGELGGGGGVERCASGPVNSEVPVRPPYGHLQQVMGHMRPGVPNRSQAQR